MDLAFPGALVLMVLLSALITGQVAGDGRSDWLRGGQLLAIYLVLALSYFLCRPRPPRTENAPIRAERDASGL